MNITRDRDTGAGAMTKVERAALELYARNDISAAAAVKSAHALFDELERFKKPVELRHEDDFDHEGTP